MFRFNLIATLSIFCLLDNAFASGQCFKAAPRIDIDLKRVSFGNTHQTHYLSINFTIFPSFSWQEFGI